MIYAIAGCPVMGNLQESLLDIIKRRMKCVSQWLLDTLNQPGRP